MQDDNRGGCNSGSCGCDEGPRGGCGRNEGCGCGPFGGPVSYTHLTLPTKLEV